MDEGLMGTQASDTSVEDGVINGATLQRFETTIELKWESRKSAAFGAQLCGN